MRKWQPLAPEQLARAEERLRHPAPGSKIEAAKKYGIDLTLLIRNLHLTPDERMKNMHQVCLLAEELRGAARRAR